MTQSKEACRYLCSKMIVVAQVDELVALGEVAMLFRAVALGAAAMALMTPAGADEPRPFSWTGFYAGIHAGYAHSSEPASLTGDPNIVDAVLMDFSSIIPTSLHPELSGFTGGLQLGHNRQLGKLVLGLEADISGLAADGSDAVARGFGTLLETRLTRELDWLSTLRGRAGFLPTQDLLVFASGGVAFGKLEQQLTFSNPGESTLGARNSGSTFVCPPGTCFAGSASEIAVGWTAGAGFEYAITPQVSLKAEYLFVDLGSRSVTARSADPGTTPDVFLKASSDTELHIIRAGMNVKF